VKKSIEYIHKTYHIKTLSITQIAQIVGLSTSRLSVLFKSETNQTINNYITHIRIEKAKMLLAQGELRINQIAEEIGYGSSQYFSQVFYEVTGLNPRDYRKNV
jgi:two-component system response regulator YesN